MTLGNGASLREERVFLFEGLDLEVEMRALLARKGKSFLATGGQCVVALLGTESDTSTAASSWKFEQNLEVFKCLSKPLSDLKLSLLQCGHVQVGIVM
jgi:hypothetical protein